MANRASIAILFLFVLITALQPIQAQNYRFSPYPDLWYNDVDGIRFGLRILGEVEGTFKDGPHRLDAGVWVGSKLPDNPVSYYFSFTEPIPAISDFGSEGNIQVVSSIRTGYSIHQLRFNKRWQQGFDELDYFEATMYGSYENMFETEYRGFPNSNTLNELNQVVSVNRPEIWIQGWQTFVGFDASASRNLDVGQFFGQVSYKRMVDADVDLFSIFEIDARQKFDLFESFKLRVRGYYGAGDENLPFEYRFFASGASIRNWNDQGISRSPGLIPISGIENGIVSFSGRANLRGYASQDGMMLDEMNKNASTSIFSFFESIWSINLEFDFPNPINKALKRNSIISDLVNVNSYLFYDIGYGSKSFIRSSFPNSTGNVEDFRYADNLLSDAGLGFQFSVNIPDYLGKDRGIFIQYDIPFWLSTPQNKESNFKYRNVIGIGAVFNF